MHSFLKLLITVVLFVGICLQVDARDNDRRRDRPARDQECHWLNPPENELCENRNYAKGFMQCGAFIVTGYCEADLQNDINGCLADNSGATRDCFKESSATFSERLRRQKARRGRRVVEDTTCVWNPNSSFQPGNMFWASCSVGGTYEYRRADCTIDGRTQTPFLFCALNDVSHTATSCMRDEETPRTLQCRRELMGIRGIANPTNPGPNFQTTQ